MQRLQRLAGRVAAVHHPQAVVVEGLDADGEAVDARAAQSGEVVGRQVVGVGLDGHLLENGVGAPLEDAVDEALQRLGRAERGGPAAEVEGAERFAVELAQTGVELAEHRLGHRLQELGAGALVEVAVGAEALLGLCPFPATRSATRSATCSAARLAAYPAARSAVRFALALAVFFASVNSSAACPAPPRPLRPALLSHQLFRGLLPRTFRALPNLLCPHLLRRPSSLPSSLRPVPFPLPPPLRPSLSLCLPPPVRPASFPRPTTFLPCCCANLCALPGVPLLRVTAPLPRPVVRAPFGRGAP